MENKAGDQTLHWEQNGHASTAIGSTNKEPLVPGVKRRRSVLDEAVLMQEDVAVPSLQSPSRSFLLISNGSGTYQSENYKPKGETLYIPMAHMGDVLINVRNVDQVSCETGTFFLGDDTNKYVGSVQGSVLNLWRYDAVERRLRIAQSLLFTSSEEFGKAVALLQAL